MLSVLGVMQERAAARQKAPGSSRFLDVSQRTGTGSGPSAPVPPTESLRGAFGVLRDSGLRIPEMHRERKVGEGRGGEGEGHFGGLGDTFSPPAPQSTDKLVSCLTL